MILLKTNFGDIKIELDFEKAPNTAKNFQSYVEDGFYDGVIFHRVISNFMIQGGCPNTKDGAEGIPGTGNPGYTVDAEFSDVKHRRGVLSMARGNDPNSAGCQFFVCHGEASFLDGQYTAFGRLLDGDETLEKIASAPTKPGGEGSSPVSPVQVTKVTVQRPS